MGSRLAAGELVQIAIEEPRPIYARIKIVSCLELAGESRVISTEPLGFRVKALFQFPSEEQTREMEAFCEELAAELGLRRPVSKA
jgi:hypothetical protein